MATQAGGATPSCINHRNIYNDQLQLITYFITWRAIGRSAWREVGWIRVGGRRVGVRAQGPTALGSGPRKSRTGTAVNLVEQQCRRALRT